MENQNGNLIFNSNFLARKIEGLNLRIRIYNCLKYNGVNTIGDLIELFKTGRILEAKNWGEKGVEEIKNALAKIGISNSDLKDLYNGKLKRKRRAGSLEDEEKRKSIEVERDQLKKRREEIIRKTAELHELGLPNRICNALARQGIYSKEQIKEQIKTGRIYNLRNIGNTGVEEILNIIKEREKRKHEDEER